MFAYRTHKNFKSLETEVFILNEHYAETMMKFRLHLIFNVNRIVSYCPMTNEHID